MRAETGNNAHTGSRQSHTTRAATAVADGFGKGVGVVFFSSFFPLPRPNPPHSPQVKPSCTIQTSRFGVKYRGGKDKSRVPVLTSERTGFAPLKLPLYQ